MLSDEEKKALERIDYIQDFIIENGQYNADVNDMQYFSKVLNLIEKQQKEIEELKEDKYGLEEEVQIQAKQLIEIDGNYISKEESGQKERKAYIKGTNDAHELCNKMWKDKIKAKIEEQDETKLYWTDEVKDILKTLLRKE